MVDIVIKPDNSKNGQNGFVGMEFKSDKSVSVIFPLGYHYSDNQDELKKELRELLYTIKRHGDDGRLNRTKTNSKKKEFPWDAYIAVIMDFMQYNYYIEREVKHKRSPLGKINWKRTISQVRPIIQDDRYPVYTDFIIRQNAKKADNLISLIHEWCVDEAFAKLGWLFTTSTFTPRKPTLKINKDNKYFISVIRDALKSTFNDRNKKLFNAMIVMLGYGETEGEEPFLLGTTNFRTVWENLIDISYGVVPRRKKLEFFPKAKWRFRWGNKETEAGKLRPDTIMRPNGDSGDVFVLDAKYYSFIDDRENVPDASDINKQVAYGEYAAQKTNQNVYNAFIIPYDFKDDPHKLRTKDYDYNYGEEYIYIGFSFIDGPNEKSYERVLGILIDTKWLMGNAGRIGKEELADFIIKSYEKAKSHNNKAE